MTKSLILNTSLEAVGENIGQELGAKMVKDFQDSFPTENQWHFVGRNIIEQILNQPNCSGVRFYNGLDEAGQKTLVLVGIDKEGQIISEYSTIGQDGEYKKIQGIVADRITRPSTKNGETSLEWWSAL